MRDALVLAALAVVAGGVPRNAHAQNTPPAADPSVSLRQVLPPDVAARVLARVADARTQGLPADVLVQSALKFAARGISPADIDRSVTEHARRLADSKLALERGRGQPSTGDEIEAGAEVMRTGVDGHAISTLAKRAPAGRSLAIPLYVVGSLVARGLPAGQALARVEARLDARVTDDDLGVLAGQAALEGDHAGERGLDVARRIREIGGLAGSGGPPLGVPGNGGASVRPPSVSLPGSGHGRPTHL